MVVDALAVRDLDRVRSLQLLKKEVGERAFADAGLAGDKHDLTSARQRWFERLPQLLKIRDPPNELRWLADRDLWRRNGAALIDNPGSRHDEAVAPPVPGLDGARASGVIAGRIAKFMNAGCEQSVADRCASPDAVKQLLFGHNFWCALDQRYRARPRRAASFHLAAVAPTVFERNVAELKAAGAVAMGQGFTPSSQINWNHR